MSAVKTFVDTNVLIYAFTADEPTKRETTLKFLDNCLPVISTQVIKEFSNILLKKTKINLKNIRETIKEIADVTSVVSEDLELIFLSFDIHERYEYSFYDSLIITAAISSKCQVLLSEDMQDGQIIDGKLKIVNPFKNRQGDVK